MNSLTRKLGPLPLYAWAGLVVVGFLLYRHFHAASASPSTAAASSTTASDGSGTYVPGFDAASGQVSGGIGATGPPQVVNNYYYGNQAAGQASGGGTSSGMPGPDATQNRLGVPVYRPTTTTASGGTIVGIGEIPK